MKYPFLSLLLLIGIGVNSQKTIEPGDTSIRYPLIKPGRSLYKLSFIDITGKRKSILINEEVIKIDSTNNHLIRSQYRLFNGNNIFSDSTIADLYTLRPIRMKMSTAPHSQSMELAFTPTIVYAKKDVMGKKTDTVHNVQKGYFASNLFEYMVGLLNFRLGMDVMIKAYVFERKGIQDYRVKYIGEDYIATSTNPLTPCHMASCDQINGTITTLIWVEKDTGRVLKQIINMPDGKFLIEKI